MVELKLSDENYQLTIECLNSLKSYLLMLEKLPLKKAKKLQGSKFVSVVDDLIKVYESEGNKNG